MFIPYLGPLIGASFGILVTISANGDAQFYAELLPMLIKVVGVFATMQMLDNFIVQPIIFFEQCKGASTRNLHHHITCGESRWCPWYGASHSCLHHVACGCTKLP